MPISPNQGPTGGGTTITITGVNLSGAQKVLFGLNQATITANTPTMVTVISPAGAGVVPVYVVTNAGPSNSLNFFYIENPILVSADSLSGPVAGGNTVNLNGFNLASSNSVSFGPNVATPTVISDSSISVVAPAGSSPGSVNISVTSGGGVSGVIIYNYVDVPTIVSIIPTSGVTTGGTGVTIIGTNLSNTTSVTIGGSVASFNVINSTSVSAVTPPGTAGAADVVITTTGGSATAVGGFTYISSPGV
jgi:hypothetical protein